MEQIKRFEDIHLSDLDLKNEYQNKMKNNKVNEAIDFVIQNPNLHNKVLESKDFNNIKEHITKLETNYFDFLYVLLKLKNIYNIKINDLNYLKEYNVNTVYQENNLVLYNKEVYLCLKKTTKGILPTNSSFWRCIGLKGKVGAKSLGIKYKGTWSSFIDYVVKDAVVYNNKLYICKVNNKGKIPKDNLKEWSLQMEVETSEITVQKEEPTLKKDAIWMQIL